MNESGQFNEKEMLTTRRIATLRIHVKRAIEGVKNDHILEFVPVTLRKNVPIDIIFLVCAMLANFLATTGKQLIIINTKPTAKPTN